MTTYTVSKYFVVTIFLRFCSSLDKVKQKMPAKKQNRKEKQLFVEMPWWKSKTEKSEKQKKML